MLTLSARWSHETLGPWLADARRSRRSLGTSGPWRTLCAHAGGPGIAGEAAVALESGGSDRTGQAG